MSEHDVMNGTHEDAGAVAPVDVLAAAKARKEAAADDARQAKVIYQAEVDQLDAQVSALNERLKLLRAEIKNCDTIIGNATKTVKVGGRSTTAPAKGRK